MKVLTGSWRIVLLCLAAMAAQAQSLEIIELEHRSASEVIPILQPLVEPGGALSGSDYKLFVRASAGNVAQLRRALAEIDREPRQLTVSVRRATRQAIEHEAIGGTAVIGNQGGRVTVHATDGSASGKDSSINTVLVMEGGSAFIATGQSVPFVTAVAAGGRRPWIAASTTYRDVNSGFLVTPRINGERVTLDISQQSQRLGANASTIETQNIETQVSGALGQWIALGGVSESAQTQGSGIASQRYATTDDAVEVWVRVESN